MNFIGIIQGFVPEKQVGNYTKMGVILKKKEEFDDFVYFEVWNDKILQVKNFPIGTKVEVSIAIKSREFNGNYFTNVSILDIKPAMTYNPASQPQYAAPQPQYAAPQQPMQQPQYAAPQQPQFSAQPQPQQTAQQFYDNLSQQVSAAAPQQHQTPMNDNDLPF